MNENDGGTPNPLSQNPLDANPSEPMEEINEVEISDIEVDATDDIPVRQKPETDTADYRRPIERESRPLTEELVEESVMVEESLDPDGRPMEKVERKLVEPKPRKKTGLIVGIIICLFVAVGCGVAAILMLVNGNNDPVAAAAKKLVDGKMPANVVVDGKIDIVAHEPTSAITKVSVDLGIEAKSGSMINSGNAEVAITFSDEDELYLSFNEVMATDGSLYLKVEGVAPLIEKINVLSAPYLMTNCVAEDGTIVDDANCTAPVVECEPCDCPEGAVCDCPCEEAEIYPEAGPIYESITMGLNIINVIDGQWLKIPVSQLSSIPGGEMMGESSNCMLDLINALNTNNNSVAEFYNKNPFIGSTTNDVSINSKFSPVRQVVFDDKALANFMNSMNGTEAAKTFYSCAGFGSGDVITASDMAELIGQLPAIYVEVDKENNFTRFYTKNVLEDGMATMTIDLSFTYPTNINVSEPVEYTTFEELLQAFFMDMYGAGGEAQVEQTSTEGMTVNVQ